MLKVNNDYLSILLALTELYENESKIDWSKEKLEFEKSTAYMFDIEEDDDQKKIDQMKKTIIVDENTEKVIGDDNASSLFYKLIHLNKTNGSSMRPLFDTNSVKTRSFYTKKKFIKNVEDVIDVDCSNFDMFKMNKSYYLLDTRNVVAYEFSIKERKTNLLFDSGESSKKFYLLYRKYKKNEIEKLFILDVLQHKDDNIVNGFDKSETVFSLLRNLWIEQSKSNEIFSKKDKKTIQDIFFSYLEEALSNDASFYKNNTLTINDLANFYIENKRKIFTDKSNATINWLATDYSRDGKNLIQKTGYTAPLKKTKEADKEKIIKQFSDKSFNKRWSIVDVFDIQNDKTRENDKKYHHITVVHGTLPKSVLSILANGLKSKNHINDIVDKSEVDVDYQYSGSALGEGVYFARLNQVSKSARYLDNNLVQGQAQFLFVADVAYTNVFKAKNYHEASKGNRQADLVVAETVTVDDLDEILARDDRNITLKNLIVVRAKRETNFQRH